MYVQVIKGKAADPAALRTELERWRDEVKPGAVGFVGSTVGITDDGTLLALARFADAASAQANAARPQQDAWWQAASKHLEGAPTFRESSDVQEIFGGARPDAGFVQIMEGRVADRAKAQAFETPEMLAELQAARPDLLGSQRVWFEDGSYIEAAYFTSEADARSGESSDDFAGPQEEYVSLFGEMTFHDLRDPLLD
jgi:hypothetical protein